MPKTKMHEEAALLMEDMKIMLAELAGATPGSALRAAVAMKRLETAAKVVTEKVLGDASVEFLSSATQGKKLALYGGMLSAYTPAAEWQYPIEIVTMERQLKELKEKAKVDGTAKAVKKAEESKRAFKVETPFSGAAFDEYREGADALAKLL